MGELCDKMTADLRIGGFSPKGGCGQAVLRAPPDPNGLVARAGDQ